jgi:hypothetical protein
MIEARARVSVVGDGDDGNGHGGNRRGNHNYDISAQC